MPPPNSLTITVAPWGGVFADRRNNSNDGTYSYYGPAATGSFRAQPEGYPWAKDWEIPTLHITLDPAAPSPYNPHISLHMGGDKAIKNAHYYWNNGSPLWDVKALDDDKLWWLNAIQTAYPNAVHQALDEVVNQITSGVAPAYVPPTPQAQQQAPKLSDADFPPLLSQASAPVGNEVSGGVAVGAAVGQAVQDPNAPSSSDPVYQPTGREGSWGAVGDLPVAYLDEMTGEGDDAWCNFAVSDGRSLGILRSTMDEAVEGTLDLPESSHWIRVQWKDEEIDLPVELFE